MSAALVAVAVLMAFAAAWELAGAVDGAARRRLRRLLRSDQSRPRTNAATALRRGVAVRLERAGLAARVHPGAVVAAKASGAAIGALAAALATPAAPARLAAPLWILLVGAGFLAPDALLERAARRRRTAFVAALPDALDVLAVGAAAGRSPAAAFAEIGAGGSGPLADELSAAAAAIGCGSSPREALAVLRHRVPDPEVGALIGALERSRSHGSPLAEQLHLQAGALRRDARRRVEERAARAAPKIQLVVALVLVPSVLLTILAAIIAHSDALFGAF